MGNEEFYLASKKRIEAILASKGKIKKVPSLSLAEAAASENGVKGWVASLSIDLRAAASLFGEEDNGQVARIVRAFYGEAYRICKSNDRCIQIEIQGDKFHAYFSTPGQADLVNVLEDAIYINTYHLMLNKMLEKADYPVFAIGIGISTSECLVVKVDEGDAPYIYIGDAVFDSAKLARQGSKDGFDEILVDRLCYDNIPHSAANEKQGYWEFFKRKYSQLLGMWCYHTSVVDANFEAWIEKKVK